MKYRVRTYQVGWSGFLTQADDYQDFDFTSELPLDEFAANLAANGFRDGDRWIMPGAIVWVKQL